VAIFFFLISIYTFILKNDFLVSSICECINPWKGDQWNEHRGNPAYTCPRFCYVDCNSDCQGKQNAMGRGRCFSTKVCPTSGGDIVF
jgi:hypothetical protein